MWILVLGDKVKNFVKNVKQYCMVLSKIKCHILTKPLSTITLRKPKNEKKYQSKNFESGKCCFLTAHCCAIS